MIARVVALVVVAGCVPQPAQPGGGPAPTDCTSIADRMYQLSNKTEGMRISRDAIEHHCRVDGWSVEARTCVAHATFESSGNCQVYLTPEQNAAVQGSVQAAMTAPTGCARYKLPNGCMSYCLQLERMSACRKFPEQTRTMLATQWQSTAAQLASVPESSWPQIEAGCAQGAVAIENMMAQQGCGDG